MRSELAFMLIADAHIDGPHGIRRPVLEKALCWARELNMDAFMDAGDYSYYGRQEERDAYWETVAEGLGGMQALVAVGNHETYQIQGQELKEYHLNRLKELNMLPGQWNKLYYEREIKGYHFLVLSQYSDSYIVPGAGGKWKAAAQIEEDQLNWLEAKLNVYCGHGKPVFAVIHNAVEEVLKKQTGNDYPDWQVILSGDRLYDILNGYPEVVLATGHVHHGYGAGGVVKTASGYHVIDTPAFCGSQKLYGAEESSLQAGISAGYFVYVYPDQILLQAVDFKRQERLVDYYQKISLPVPE